MQSAEAGAAHPQPRRILPDPVEIRKTLSQTRLIVQGKTKSQFVWKPVDQDVPVIASSSRNEIADHGTQLMLQVKEGDPAAFDKLYDTFRPRLESFLRRRVADESCVDDLVQQVFLRVFRSRSAYVPSGRFSAWIFTIAANLASNEHRSLKRRRVTRGGQHGPIDPDVCIADERLPEAVLILEETQSLVRSEIDNLPKRQRSAVLNCYLRQQPISSFAARADCSVAAVKGLLSRAKEQLRKRLGHSMAEPGCRFHGVGHEVYEQAPCPASCPAP